MEKEPILQHNTPKEPIHLTGLPVEIMGQDTPSYLTDVTYNNILEGLQCGIPLLKTVKEVMKGGSEDPNLIAGRILRWIHSDEGRKEEYEYARKLGTEILSDEILEISNGTDPNGLPEDVARSTLRISARKFIMGVNNRTRFGDEKTQNVNVTLVDVMKSAEKRIAKVIEGDVVES